MELETFFEQFELLADAPNGVQKLRELILQLAVQGKLVPQDPNDEPAEVLLERIEAEKKRLVKEGKIKKEKKLPALEVNELPFDLPSTWKWVRLGRLCLQVSDGPHFSPNYVLKQEGIPFLSTRNIKVNGFELDSVKYISRKDHQEFCQRIKPEYGDVLYTKGGTTGIALVNDLDFEFSVWVHLAVLKVAQNHLDPWYIAHALNSPHCYIQSQKYTHGSSNKDLGLTRMILITLPLPPVNEQHRIVAKVDRLMSLCDELEARQEKRRARILQLGEVATSQLLTPSTPEAFNQHWQGICDNFDLLYSTPENVSQLRQAILQLAVMGKLVPQDSNDEPASVLLERIKEEKARLVKEGKIRKPEKLPPVDVDELEYDIPKEWSWSRLADICELITDGTHQTPKYTEQGRIFLSAQNVKPFRFMPEIHKFVSEADYQGYIKNRKPEFQDILMTRVGAGIGEAAVIDQSLDFAIYVSVALIRPFKKFINPYYLTIWLNSPSGTRKSSTNTYGKGVSQGNLNLGLIRKFLVTIPPINEQKRIVAKVDQLMSICDELEARLTQSLSAREKLMETAVYQVLAA
jgi:type I restriction enzyme, S subunit